MPDLLSDLPVTREEKRACLKREIGYRERVYPRWVAEGKMKQEKADAELRVMKAILADYQ